MDQYPDENEEFELQYQDELEMLNELPQEYDDLAPSTSRQAAQQLNKTKLSNVSHISSALNSPQLSQISFGGESQNLWDSEGNGPVVNRRLFGTPQGHVRGCSTPLVSKKRLPAIEEVVATQPPGLTVLPEEDEDEAVQRIEHSAANEQLQGIGKRSKRRLERDLFGDICDLYENNSYEDPIAKKAKTEEERDMVAIERILDLRRKALESSKTLRKDDLSRLQELHHFKMNNLSYRIPTWPFLPLERLEDQRRVYVRYHSEEYERRALEAIKVRSEFTSLLGEAKQQVWSEASDIVLRRASTAASVEVISITEIESANSVPYVPERLWVDKYKPRKYIDLLSDEMTNRSLLYWLKMWDKIVFGKEFHKKHNEHSGQMNSFNKRTGKFESNGWQQRKNKQTLNTNVDDHGRPVQKVALLCGPPGLGKTTLAHTIARHAGYNVREINASDDRSPEAFKLALENGTQMTSVLNESRRPNCIILDEIDGAPRPSIEYLVKFVSDNVYNKSRGAGGKAGAKGDQNILKRPIICICNDVYDPALRPLRLIAFVVSFPPIDSARLAERLMQIAHKERLKTDFGTLIALAEKSGNDVRSCISTMQFFGAQKYSMALQDVLNNNLGQKDRHQGLFDVWGAIFRIQRPKKQLQLENGSELAQVTMTDMSIATRAKNVLDAVHAGGDYERLMQGVYENYLHQKMPDANMEGIIECMEWFCFADAIQRQIAQQQNYTVYPYLQFGFVAWHLLFATLAWPKITFPTRGFEFHQKSNTQHNIYESFRKGITTNAQGVGSGHTLLVDTVPLLKRIISPQLRSVAVQLLSQKEQNDLKHTIDIMVDLGITFVQVKNADGHYVFQIEPDLDLLASFEGYQGVTLPYFSRQLIAREIELERIRRATPKVASNISNSSKKSPFPTTSKTSSSKLPNHLQTLKPKQITANAMHNAKQSTVISKDFFGRVQQKTINATSSSSLSVDESGKATSTDAIVKSPIWYRYKEGFNNAVRKDVHLYELL